MSKPYTVVVVFEAKPGEENTLASALEAVVQPSRTETTCLEYRLHKSVENPSQFVLYENWESKEKHQEQFSKPYTLELGEKLSSLLAKPYQVIFAEKLCR